MEKNIAMETLFAPAPSRVGFQVGNNGVVSRNFELDCLPETEISLARFASIIPVFPFALYSSLYEDKNVDIPGDGCREVSLWLAVTGGKAAVERFLSREMVAADANELVTYDVRFKSANMNEQKGLLFDSIEADLDEYLSTYFDGESLLKEIAQADSDQLFLWEIPFAEIPGSTCRRQGWMSDEMLSSLLSQAIGSKTIHLVKSPAPIRNLPKLVEECEIQ